MNLSIELDREDDGRWIAEALELPGVMTYGNTREEAISNTERLAIEVIADRIKHGEMPAAAQEWPDYEFAFHDKAELGRKILSRIARHTGLRPEDL